MPQLRCFGGYSKEEAIHLLRLFYAQTNMNAPEHKRKLKS
jgi:hypothetical protein